MKKYLFLSLYEFLLCLFYVLLLIVGKNEIFASSSSKVEYIKRDTPSNNDICSSLNFSTVLSNAKVFGFYDPLKPLENNSSVVEFIKDIRIDYLIVDINILKTNETIQELSDLRSNFSSKELQILLSITSSDLFVLESPNPITENVKKYGLDGVNIIYICNISLDYTVDNIKTMHSDNWNTNWITTFTVNANYLSTISSIKEYVNYTIIQAFYLNSNVASNLLNGLNGMDFKKLIWGFDLSGIMNTKSVTGLMINNDTCLGPFFIWPWKEIRNTALTDMCIANNDKGWTRNFDANTNSTILSNSQLNVFFAYEDPESLYHKFNWVISNKFAGISIANLAFDSVDDNKSILKFIKKTAENGNNGTNGTNKDNPTSKDKDNNNNNNNDKTTKNNNSVIIGVVVGSILFALVLLIGFFYCSRRRKRNSEIEFKSIEDKHHYLDQPVIPPSPSPTPQQNSIVPTNGIYASALYDFEGKEENELNFRKGDLIEVIEKGDGPNSWWKGKINGIVGDFPGNYVLIK